MKSISESFSEREVEVLRALAEGLSNSEIADKLFLAPNTVKWYVRHLNSKLDTNNREEIVERAEVLGLLNCDKPYAAPILHNLPYQTSLFVGRDTELDELHTMLKTPEIRLLTILAQGGMGKTRIALEAAEQQLTQFPNGVFFVPLQALSDISQILPHLASSAGYQIVANDKRSDKEQVLNFFANKTMLLLIDNWEHLLDGTEIISEILLAAPNVKVLATSREKLKLSGETVYLLRGMAFPSWESPADALEYDAVRLLEQSARRVKPDWEVTEANLDTVSRICRLTEGMPLGILLAVAWLDMLSLEEIAQEIQNSVDFLETDMRDVPERQRSVRAIFEAAWKRLEPLEQQVFMKMAVFKGGCSRKAAEAIAGANLRILQSLVNKALIIRRKDERFEIHELLRQYAEIELKKSGQAEMNSAAHCSYYAEVIHEREAWLRGGKQLEALRDIESDFENMRSAWHWAVANHDWQAIDGMMKCVSVFCVIKGRWQEYHSLVVLALAELSEDGDAKDRRMWGKVMARSGLANLIENTVQEYQKNIEKALQIARENEDDIEIAFCLRCIAHSYRLLGQEDEAWKLYEDVLAFARAKHDPINEIYIIMSLCFLAGHRLNKMTRYAELQLEGLELARELKNIVFISDFLVDCGIYAVVTKEYALAEAYHLEALSLRRSIGSIHMIHHTLANLADIAALQGKFELAHDYMGDYMAIAQYNNNRLSIINSLGLLADICIRQGDYTKALELAEEACQSLLPTDDSLEVAHLNSKLAMAVCGVGDYAQAASILYPILVPMSKYAQNRHLSFVLLGLALVLTFHEKLAERAVEIAALVAQQPTAVFWDVHPLVHRLLEHLQSVLAPDVYAAAWERGKNWEFLSTARQLAEEFAPK
jgi:predicted ATPase/DNA-binding CsgD family transcriptional regulator